MLKAGIYVHYKGNEYEVMDIATHSETEEKMVVYKALYGEFGLWVRPLSMFDEVMSDGRKRFAFVREKNV
ncbi:MAG TPA: DUF1653 domain-containing protein [Sulfuricurvum sp.]|nr:MAG: hypothetical protein B7Y30_05365 [Campylobacterales bacterium 16-40-21]OZA03252.1 MAG: hypothetical protein B7X89_04470 [Sulfuricurvum sp. 17-40-25]HQS66433.1 DUF1653 domain-containing protein [Sulfuricurvum sp.]HQT37085.1 DUF1653 domain-containing protein [Sulfuricurvum sp.]